MISRKETKRKGYKKKEIKKVNSHGFPNVFLNRNVVGRSNVIWQVDATFLDVTLNNQEETKHCLLSGVDPATNKLVFAKVFYSGFKKKTFTTKMFIKTLQTAIQNKQIKNTLMIHSDRGPQLTSKEYVEFIEKQLLLIGSQTSVGQPNQNAVIKRLHQTFKNQLKGFKLDLPKNVRRTRDLQNFCDKRRMNMNSKALYAKTLKTTV